ncbi:MAG TPA: hypothetical protein VKR06_26465 [Ktedonosporobacter sp.]|nr:hypothetical protein [Ktedonosporobacter sp.]
MRKVSFHITTTEREPLTGAEQAEVFPYGVDRTEPLSDGQIRLVGAPQESITDAQQQVARHLSYEGKISGHGAYTEPYFGG